MENEFRCLNCKRIICHSQFTGTEHRNHCPFCLYSKHVDEKTSGDRKSTCKAKMAPIGLTFKYQYAIRNGELMLIHKCTNCDKISINRIAGDDFQDEILAVFEKSKNDENLRAELSNHKIIPDYLIVIDFIEEIKGFILLNASV